MSDLSVSAAAVPGLHALFNPRSIALVGATERSIWSNSAYGNLQRFGFAGQLHLVNPKGGELYGRAAATSCQAIGSPVDLALVMVPESAMLGALDDLAAAQVQGAVIISAGFSESGVEGERKQAQLVAAARERGIRLLGPNCLGLINYHAQMPLWGIPMRRAHADGRVAVVSQSGALGGQIGDFAFRLGIGLGYLVSTGNEADIGVAEVVQHLASDDKTQAIALFLESVRDPERFAAAVRAARAAGKSVIALKVGRSEKTRQAAQSHTGALVGDDAVFDAVCRQLGIVRVDSLEGLLVTADLASRLPTHLQGGVGVVSISGGMCEIAADAAQLIGLSLPDLAPETAASLQSVMTEFGVPANPLDVTGAAMLKPELFEEAVARLGSDPHIGAVVTVFDAPQREKGGEYAMKVMRHVHAGLARCGKPGLLVSHTFAEQHPEVLKLISDLGLAYSGAGVQLALTALAGLLRREPATAAVAATVPTHSPSQDQRPVTEQQALRHLAAHGVAVVEAHLATDAASAARIAAEIKQPLALKIASPDIAHKTEVGGVLLNVPPQEAAQAFERIMASVRAKAPEAQIDGVVLSAMRGAGLELIAGVQRDPQWGLMLAVGLGGVLVEALKDSSLRCLPVNEADVQQMLNELRTSRLLDGFRGSAPVDRAQLARTIVGVARAAEALGPDLQALEVNPLRCTEGRIEALDALAVWADAPAAH